MSTWCTHYPTKRSCHHHLQSQLLQELTSPAISWVSCVRFSADGKYLATRSWHQTRIYDAETGVQIWLATFIIPWLTETWILISHDSLLVDKTIPTSSTSYYWIICFSPDGKLLADGATDEVIWVCSGSFTLHGRVAISILEPRRSMHYGFRDSRFGISPRGKSATHSEVTLIVNFARSRSRWTGGWSSLRCWMAQ